MTPPTAVRCAVVTGGTRGVGRATSLALAGAGVAVVAVYRGDDDAAERLAAAPGWDARRCRTVRADLTTPAGREVLSAAVRDQPGGVDLLVNNFGSYRPAPLAASDEQEISDGLHTNLTAQLLVTRALLGLLTDGGAVVNVGAGMADRGRPGHVVFTAAKAGLAGFTRALAKELAPRSIRVNTVAPGVVVTERGLDLPPPVRAALLAAIPLRRFVTATDVAEVVCFLGDARCAGAITGSTINVDGGL
ncbi:SDR family oxidoreductase [Solwaraspora sp. WMMA2056]|uniref:SDR family NAD(P)-dependent oxidoreductase n=1 Tax=Solwaraspora sp. WMMA2056 TaxID=3015161 RepID=UPI00259AF469|nr:SDR family oxidoreductase [Solwaraspora sp. WMMA2056]WJK38243.1 SDR family oxidoreductase [Solwaraspora sp. WMMA2056]